MTKTVIIIDSICTIFNKIHEKLIFEQNYDIVQFITDYQNAIMQTMYIVRIQNKEYVKQELIEVVNNQMFNILYTVVFTKRNKEEFWLKV